VWTEPRNIGGIVNSKEADITPFLAPDGTTLYFSSGRPGGFGNNDVYVTRRLDSTWRNWSEPKNLGYPINTPGWDAYYTVPASGEYAYLVSTLDGYGKSDIFRIRLPKELAPAPVLLVIGTVKDVKGNVVPARVMYERLSDHKQLGTAYANPKTGEFTLALPAGEQYGFRAEHDGYYPQSENLDLRSLEQYTEVRKDLVLAPIVSGTTVRLNNLFFDYDKAVLRQESNAEILRLVEFMKSNPSMRIEISGHTDGRGADEYNLELSQRRADAVVRALEAAGIEASRLVARGYGKRRPIDTNDTEEGRQNNRRVEFTIQ
jgi:OmpA-OmpF porin, OOP family